MKIYFRHIAVLLIFLSGINVMTFPQDPAFSGTWLQPGQQEDAAFNWKAYWVWFNAEGNGHSMFARKTFRLETPAPGTVLRITASDRYELYVNGTYLCRGPARSAPHHQSYDILEIGDYLLEGINTIAIRVHHQEGKRSYHHEGRGGLIAQINFPGEEHRGSIRSDTSWKVLEDPSWSPDAPKISRFQDFVNDRVDLRHYPYGWNKPGFNDNDWVQASALMRRVGWPSPQQNASPHALTPPWTSLIPRDIPYLVEQQVRATELTGSYRIPEESGSVLPPFNVKDHQVKSDHQFKKEIQKNKDLKMECLAEEFARVLLFDFGRVIIGMPRLELTGPEGTVVDVMCAPYILEDIFTHQIVDAECLDRIVLSGKRDAWEATYFKPARYMAVAFRGRSGTVPGKKQIHLHWAGIKSISYPFRPAGSVQSAEAPWIETYWEASKKTIDVCTTDGYTDNYRERRQYAQTGYYAALGNYWTFGDLYLQRRYLFQVAQEQMANGIMPAYAPSAGNDYMVIMDSNLLWIRSLRNYFLYSGDTLSVQQLLPSAVELMGLLLSYTDETGMITNPPYAYWLDHAVNDRRGANLTLNGHFLGALEDFAELLEWLGEKDAEKYRGHAEKIRRSARRLLWDPKTGLFADAWISGERSPLFSEHANAMALTVGIPDKEQASSICKNLLADDDHNYIKRASGITMVTPAMSYFLHKGLCEQDLIEPSFEMFRDRFDKMLCEKTNGTLWEEWFVDGTARSGKLQFKTRSDAQTESAFPPALIVEYILGVVPVSPGMKEIKIRNLDSGVKNISAELPSPMGSFQIAWQRNTEEGSKLDLEIPPGMEGKIDIETLSPGGVYGSIQWNGTALEQMRLQEGLLNEGILTVKEGKHSFEF